MHFYIAAVHLGMLNTQSLANNVPIRMYELTYIDLLCILVKNNILTHLL
jgi:hypothetical protein